VTSTANVGRFGKRSRGWIIGKEHCCTSFWLLDASHVCREFG